MENQVKLFFLSLLQQCGTKSMETSDNNNGMLCWCNVYTPRIIFYVLYIQSFLLCVFQSYAMWWQFSVYWFMLVTQGV